MVKPNSHLAMHPQQNTRKFSRKDQFLCLVVKCLTTMTTMMMKILKMTWMSRSPHLILNRRDLSHKIKTVCSMSIIRRRWPPRFKVSNFSLYTTFTNSFYFLDGQSSESGHRVKPEKNLTNQELVRKQQRRV